MRPMTPPDSPQLFTGLLLAIVAAAYGGVVVLRKQRFRALSARLDAAYVDAGLFQPGKVVGHNFEVQALPTGAGKGRTYRTTVRVAMPRAPGDYVLRAEFFDDFPDWRFAMSPGMASQRVFGLAVSMPAYVETTPEQRRMLTGWLRHCDAPKVREDLRNFHIPEIRLENGHGIVSFRGAVTNHDRIQGALKLLGALADLPPSLRE